MQGLCLWLKPGEASSCPLSLLRLTDEVVGLSNVVVPDGDLQGLLGQVPVLDLITELLQARARVRGSASWGLWCAEGMGDRWQLTRTAQFCPGVYPVFLPARLLLSQASGLLPFASGSISHQPLLAWHGWGGLGLSKALCSQPPSLQRDGVSRLRRFPRWGCLHTPLPPSPRP